MNPTPLFATPRRERLFLLVLAAIQFTHILDFMIMMPLGPQFLHELNINTHDFGLLLSSYTFAAAISALLGASFVDRFDRRRLILTLYFLFMLATLCCGLAPGYGFLLVARALAGIFGGLLGSLVTTTIADTIPFERRGKAMGLVMMSFSISTVAGVPLGLTLANLIPSLGWRAPFFFIVLLCAGALVLAWRVLPSLTGHMAREREGSVFQQLLEVARHREHLKAFAFMSVIMMSGFMVIPYISLYTTSNVQIDIHQIAWIYVCGGLATLVSSQLIGRLADRYGKRRVYTAVATVGLIPVLVTTHLVPVPLWVVLINSSFFFVLNSGRMIPGMALVSAVPSPQLRGSFMSLLSAVQMLAGGVATLVAGVIITRNPAGLIEHYDIVGYISVACGMASIWLVHYLRTNDTLAT